MLVRMSLNWWTLALRGVAAIVFGVLAFLWPSITLLALVLLFAAFAFIDGVLALASGIRNTSEGQGPDWFLILGGIAGIAAGAIAVAMPGITAFVLLLIIAAWAIVTGFAELAIAYRLRNEIRGEWLLAIDGVVSVVFGLLLVIFPTAGALAVVWLIAAFAIVSGVMLLALAFRLRSRFRTTASSAA
jgi:uncharacterized membrane protein HdeD (DUF308 family)